MTVRGLILLAAIAAAAVATVLGFRWFGTDGADWPGWLALSWFLALVSELEFAGRPLRRAAPPPG